MSILIGLAVATLLVWGWACGSVLVATFLTLGELVGMAMIGLFRDGNPTLVWTAVIMQAVIWAPIIVRSQAAGAKPAAAIQPGSLPLVLTLKTPEERTRDIVGAICTVLIFAGLGWMFLHDTSDTWRFISSRAFISGIGFVALASLALGWASRQSR